MSKVALTEEFEVKRKMNNFIEQLQAHLQEVHQFEGEIAFEKRKVYENGKTKLTPYLTVTMGSDYTVWCEENIKEVNAHEVISKAAREFADNKGFGFTKTGMLISVHSAASEIFTFKKEGEKKEAKGSHLFRFMRDKGVIVEEGPGSAVQTYPHTEMNKKIVKAALGDNRILQALKRF